MRFLLPSMHLYDTFTLMRTPLKPEQLGPEFIHQVVYCMENQQEEYLLNLDTLEFVTRSSLQNSLDAMANPVLIPIPSWEPSDGFRVMEAFTIGLGNPHYREKLRLVITSGGGVFRKFKNILKESPWLMAQWHAFKNSYMQQIVLSWIQESEALREVLLLAEEGIPESTENIFFEDFLASSMKEEERKEVVDFLQNLAKVAPHLIYMEGADFLPHIEGARDIIIIRDPLGELVALTGIAPLRGKDPNSQESVYTSNITAIDPRVEGIGLWEHLLSLALTYIEETGATQFITTEIPYREGRDKILHQTGFQRKSIRYEISLNTSID